MGVYIKEMKPPKHCYDCDFNNGRTCFANEEKTFDITEEYAKRIKHPDCPLVDVKAPHGRLIDESVLNERANLWMTNFNLAMTLYEQLDEFYKVAEIPTVIEAEVE